MKFRVALKSAVNFQGEENSQYFGISELEHSETGLERYTSSIVTELLKGFDPNRPEGAIVDFGAGTGQIAKMVKERTGIDPVCIEVDERLILKLKNGGFKTESSLTNLKSRKISFIFSSNVLEHIESDLSVLRDMHEVLEPGGSVSVFVPALPFLYSYFDQRVGHFRRYSRSELVNKLEQSNFEIVQVQYFDCIGVLAWFLMKINPLQPILDSEVSLLMRIYDRLIFPLSRFFDRCGFSRLIGKNLIVIARKRNSSNTGELN